ncbi:MAG: hypothetical protein FWC53_04405 [Firmicutes bacterium]|nr:hypothetical protein [Bacillota bacterium]
MYSNTAFGIYGKLSNLSSLGISAENSIDVANRDEIKTGPAKIVLNIENGVRKEYDVQITKIYRNNNTDNKSMLIKVTDKRLLDLTGGIIQGMSGSPIVQGRQICSEQSLMCL